MGFVFQSFNLVPTLTALENIRLACDYAGVKGTDAQAAAEHVLRLVGLADRAGHRPRSCQAASSSASPPHGRWSTGPRSCWPTSPPATSTPPCQEVLDSCAGSIASTARRYLLVTHDPEVGEACDRVVDMRDGLVADRGILTLPPR